MIMPGIVFEELGFKYLGPIDGHNIAELENVLTRAKNTKGPVLVHVCTQKGRGYTYAEKNPAVFHGISPFEVETGEVIANKVPGYSDVFGSEIVRIAEKKKGLLLLRLQCLMEQVLSNFQRDFRKGFLTLA